jgi:cell division transport system permease protein
MLDRLSFVVGEAMVALRRNGFMTFAAVSTVAVSLFLLGALGYSYIRAVEYAKSIPGKFDMRVFLVPGTSPKAISDTATKIRSMPGVATVSWIPRDKAWEKEKRDDPANTMGLENPYPDGLKVTIKNLKVGDAVAKQLSEMPVIDPDPGVIYLKEEQHLIDDGLQIMRWLGLVIASLLFFTAGVLIFNAIKLTITHRRREIRIMQLVGASQFTVQCPFLIEGIMQGFLGGCVAAWMLYGAQNVFQNFLMTLSTKTHLAPFPWFQATLIMGAVGGAYGLLCSWLAISSTSGAQ